MPVSLITDKARNLQRLAELGFDVPNYVVINRQHHAGRDYWSTLRADCFMVRPCALGEDSQTRSRAGQLASLGPIRRHEIASAVNSLFLLGGTEEIIIQEFVDGPTGVIFCPADGPALLEYSRIRQGVTAGKVKPFCASLPNNLSRYAALTKLVLELFQAFGPCDAELAVLDSPRFFQVRPLTAPFLFDEELVTVKMLVQELSPDHFMQNEFCFDICESQGWQRYLIDLFCSCSKKLFPAWELERTPFRPEDFLVFADQCFVSHEASFHHPLSKRQAFRIGSWAARKLMTSSGQKDASPEQQFEYAAAVRLASAIADGFPGFICSFLRRPLLNWRMAARKELCKALAAVFAPDLTLPKLSRQLRDPLIKRSATMEWICCDWQDSAGIIVVDGDFSSGPFLRVNCDKLPTSMPEDRPIVLCDQLYPSLHKLFPVIKGIICERGAITSHLAILAQEEGMALKIQAGMASTGKPYSVPVQSSQ